MGGIKQLLPKELQHVFLRYYDERPYQIKVIITALKKLQSGSNVAIILPPGLGKTLISQIVALKLYRSRIHPMSKTLVVVPSRLLLDQHYEDSFWLNGYLNVERLKANHTESPSAMQRFIDSSNMLVTTPKLMTNLLAQNIISFSKLDEFGLIVVDEYDEFAKAKPSRTVKQSRFRKDIDELMSFLIRRNPLFLLLSAMFMEDDPRLKHWEKLLKPTMIQLDERLYYEYVPLMHVRFEGIYDADVVKNDAVFKKCIAENLNFLESTVELHGVSGHNLKIRDILDQMHAIASGIQKEFYVFFRNRLLLSIPIDEKIKLAFQQIAQAVRIRLFLFEDMFLDINPDEILRQAASSTNKISKPTEYQFRASLRGKAEKVKSIIKQRQKKRAAIFCRNIDVCEQLASNLSDLGLPIFVVHGELEPTERQRRIHKFKTCKPSIMIVTRRLGGRGFDLPEADYSIFYSPKEEEHVMWQEMLRIRSMRKYPKEVFILYYTDTAEEAKMQRLRRRMEEKENYLFKK